MTVENILMECLPLLFWIIKNRIFMARDRAGEKPFYYFKNNGSFVFSSELKALMKWNNGIRKIDKESNWIIT